MKYEHGGVDGEDFADGGGDHGGFADFVEDFAYLLPLAHFQ